MLTVNVLFFNVCDIQGKTLSESETEVTYGASFIEWFSEEARRVYGDTIPSPAPTRRLVTIRQPVGVAGMITPVCVKSSPDFC